MESAIENVVAGHKMAFLNWTWREKAVGLVAMQVLGAAASWCTFDRIELELEGFEKLDYCTIEKLDRSAT